MKKFLPVFLLLACPAYAADVAPAGPFIHVSGEAKVDVAPDEVDLSFTITSHADNYADALKSADTRFASFMTFLADEKIPQDSVVSYQINVTVDRPEPPPPVMPAPPPLPSPPMPATPMVPAPAPAAGAVAPAAPMSPGALATQILAAGPMMPVNRAATASAPNAAQMASIPPVTLTAVATMAPGPMGSPDIAPNPGTDRPITYHATRDVEILLKDVKQFPAVYDKILELEAEGYVNVQFKTSHEGELKKKLLAEASSNAKQKAMDLCAGFGMEIDSVHAISEQNFSAIANNFIPQDDGGPRPFGMVMTAAAKEDNGRDYLIPKTLECKSEIFVIFTIKPNH